MIIYLRTRLFDIAIKLGLVTQDEGFEGMSVVTFMSFAKYLPLQVDLVNGKGGSILRFCLTAKRAAALGLAPTSFAHNVPGKSREAMNKDNVKNISESIVKALNVFGTGGVEFKLE